MFSFVLTLKRLAKAIALSWKQEHFRGTLFLCFLILLSGVIFYSTVEGWPVLDALYFSAMMVTTVGHDVLTPLTSLGKIFTVLYMFAGIGIFVALFTQFAQTLISDLEDRHTKKTK